MLFNGGINQQLMRRKLMGMTFQSFLNFKDDYVLISLQLILFLFWIENFERHLVEEKTSFVSYKFYYMLITFIGYPPLPSFSLKFFYSFLCLCSQ